MHPGRSLLSALILVASAQAQLPVGNYTIDPSLPAGSGNFTTFGSAIAALAGGITGTGPTVFLVASTTFNEAVAFPTITGTSAASPITFMAVGPPAIIDAGGAQDAFRLDGLQSHLHFENLHIQGWTRYGLALDGTSTTNNSTFCTFKWISVDGPATSSSTIRALHNFRANDCEFDDCTFAGGGNVLRSESINRNIFRRCTFDGKNVAARLLAPFNSNDSDNRWENCVLFGVGPTGEAINLNTSSYGNMFWHNTIVVTTSTRAIFFGGCCAWTRASNLRNNIVVNLGTGVCVTYGANSTTGILDFNDADFNVYYAPNGNAVAKEGNVGFTTGSLAAWQAFHAANPSFIPAGGGTNWDQNSIEADPGLVSMTAPYDFHLTPGSVCIDAGTTNYIPGPWITYTLASSVPNDFELDPRPATGVDIGADEDACSATVYSVNNPIASFDVDGIQGNACIPAVTVKTPNAPGSANLQSINVGFGFDLALTPAALVPLGGGGIASPNGQIVNVDLTSPGLIFLNGGLLPSIAVPFPGNFSLPFNAPPSTFTIGGQMLIVDLTHPDGFVLSQGASVVVL